MRLKTGLSPQTRFGISKLQSRRYTMEEKNISIELPWTIEQQLKAYAEAKGHTERHEILQQSWEQNRRWFAQKLEFTLVDFPNYSQHNETHCRAVIHNIECLLGEEEIRRLSPTDCFSILMTVYLHDLGMCITDADREQIIQSQKFMNWIEQLEQNSDSEYQNAIKALKRTDYSFKKTDSTLENNKSYRRLYEQKMDVFYALSFLISEQQRKHHAEIAAERMAQLIHNPDGTQNGLSITGIPDRIFLLISQCAALHGISNLEDVMSLLMQLPECDNGFAQDFYHPRFAAVFLLIGDALDIDNQRFHPFAREYAGKRFNKQSEMHYRKHHAIRALQIAPERIYIRADCQDPSEMRQLRNEINWLQQFIKECSYQWAKIAPDNFCGCLPVVDFERISLGGMPMSERLVQAQFQLSQEKAFRLLEGVSLYNKQYVYLREMVQNAADAVKFQYWNDLDATDLDTTADIDLCRANEALPLQRYPIKIRFALRKRRRETPDNLQKITAADLLLSESELEQYEFGVEASVQDCGIGIGEEDLCAISKVGTSQDHRLNTIERMPLWLRPTGKFGIGLQSLFQADNIFWCITRTHENECYKMIFHSGTRNEGYINVIPKDWRDGERGGVHYGTRFTLFVPVDRVTPSEDGLGRPKMDPFHKDYQRGATLIQSFKMMKQMEYYLDGEIGENIFPIRLEEEALDVSLEQEGWSEWIMPKQIRPFQRLNCVMSGNSQKEPVSDYSGTTCWLFRQFTERTSNNFLRGQLTEENGSAYYWDVDNCKLYIWSQRAKCFFTCGATRIIQAITPDDSRKRKPENIEEYGTKIRLFLKGLLVTDIKYAGNELIETIDIKNDSLQNYLLMNRSALRPEGEKYVCEEIIPLLHQTFCAVLQDINRKTVLQLERNRMQLKASVCKEYETICREFVEPNDRKGYYFLLKKLDALELSDFILIKNDFEWAMEDPASQDRAEKDRVFHVEKNCLFDCVAQADFTELENVGNDVYNEETSKKVDKERDGKNPILSSCRQRMKNYLYTQVNLWKENELDCVSYFLNKLVKLLRNIDTLMQRGKEEFSPTNMSTLIGKVNQLREHVIFYAMFFFYMNRKGLPSSSVCTRPENDWCGWEYINDRISKTLKNSQRIFQHMLNKADARIIYYNSTLFIPGCKERPYNSLTPGGYSFSELMRNDRHFAVFSHRASHNDPWKHLLVELCPLTSAYKEIEEEGGIRLPGVKKPTLLDILEHMPKNQKECGSRWAFLEDWNSAFIEQMQRKWINRQNPNGDSKRSSSSTVMDESIWGNEFTRWIVRKLPSISMGADAEGNNRLNVLICRVQSHVFFDSRMISLMVARMKKQYIEHNDLRFSIPVWDSLDALKCKEIPYGVAEVNRGAMSAANKNNRMLLMVGSELPPGCCRPEEDAFGNRQEKLPKDIKTIFDLLDRLRASYQTPTKEPMFAFSPAMRIFHEYQSILQMEPFSEKFIKADLTVVYKLREYCESNDIEIDSSLAVRDDEMLQRTIQDIYWSYFSDHNSDDPQPTRYTEINLPQDRQKFINSFMIEIFIPQEHWNKQNLLFTDIPHYSKKEEFDDAVCRVYSAMDYCEMAPRDYRDTFLESACAWYQAEVWRKDPSTKTFLRISQDLCGGTSLELEALYMTQLRRLLCAMIINSQPMIFQDDMLTAIRRIKRDRTQTYNW